MATNRRFSSSSAKLRPPRASGAIPGRLTRRSWMMASLAGAGSLVGVGQPGCQRSELTPDSGELGVAPRLGPAVRGRQLQLVASVAMVADCLREIAGPGGDVQVLIGPGIDPHQYRPTRDDVLRLLAADSVWLSGWSLEGRLAQLLGSGPLADRTVAVAERLPQPSLLRGGDGGAVDPHVWLNPTAWSGICPVMAERLAELDPASAQDYRQRAGRLQRQLIELHQRLAAELDGVPPEHRCLVTPHAGYAYFGQAFGLETASLMGVSTESETGLWRLRRVVELVVQRRLPAVFYEAGIPKAAILAVLRGCQALGHTPRLLGPLYCDCLGATGTPADHYIGMLTSNVRMVAQGLGGGWDADRAA
jgi:manganese/zinc/iron transport system substrate-binding protein